MTRDSTRLAVSLVLVAVGGYVSALQLIDVKPYAVFQHYYPWRVVLSDHPLPAAALAGQAFVVALLGWRLRARLRAIVSRLMSWQTWLVIGALAAFCLAIPAIGVSRFLEEVVLAGGIAVVALVNLLLAVLVLPEGAISRLSAWVDARVTLRPGADGARWDRMVPVVVAVWVAVVAAIVSWGVFERVPHIDDSVSNLFQAKYFAAGHLVLPAPPDAPSFQVDQTIVEPTKWYGYAFPGWPLVLALGVMAGAPWVVNPLLGGLAVLLGHAYVRRRCDRGTANATVLMLAGSPWLIFMSAEFMAHPLTAVLVLLGLLAFDHASERSRGWPAWGALAGFAVGALALTRSIDAALVVVALAVIVLVDRRVWRSAPAVIVAGAIAVMVASLSLPYNARVTGDPMYPPHMAWSDRRWGPGVDRLGFGPDIGIRAFPNLDPLPGHGAADVVLNLNKNLFLANTDLFGWAPGSLMFVWLALAVASWRRGDAFMLALPAAYIVGYSAYWFSGGPDLGPRYWYPSIIALAAMTARGAQMAAARLGARDKPTAGARVAAFIAVASLSAAILVVPWRAATKYHRYRGITGEIRELARAAGFHHALVFVRADDNRRDYQSAFSLNPWTLDDPATIYAYDAGPVHRAAVVAHFADRPVWVIGRRRETQTDDVPFVVIAGPLPAGTAPK